MPVELTQTSSGVTNKTGVVVRAAAALLFVVILLYQTIRVEDAGSLIMCAATWVVLIHLLIGEYVFMRYLHGGTRMQRALDIMAGILLLGVFAGVGAPALWCAFMAGFVALATVKYLLIERTIQLPALRQYAREKIRWESPAVLLFALLAVVISTRIGRFPVRFYEWALLACSLAFAVWMIGIRHIYRRAAVAAREKRSRL